MNCESFSRWLENRDTHDISEADRAVKHASDCQRCRKLLEKDEALDRAISKSMVKQPLPESLKHSVDLSLDREAPAGRRGGVFAAVSVACLLVAVVLSLSLRQNFGSMDEMGRYMVEGHLDHSGQFEIFEPVGDANVWLADMVDESVHGPAYVPAGYGVRGARFCTLGHCLAAHMIFEKDGTVLSVFVVDEEDVGFRMKQGRTYSVDMVGNRVTFWKQDHRVFALVS